MKLSTDVLFHSFHHVYDFGQTHKKIKTSRSKFLGQFMKIAKEEYLKIMNISMLFSMCSRGGGWVVVMRCTVML